MISRAALLLIVASVIVFPMNAFAGERGTIGSASFAPGDGKGTIGSASLAPADGKGTLGKPQCGASETAGNTA